MTELLVIKLKMKEYFPTPPSLFDIKRKII